MADCRLQSGILWTIESDRAICDLQLHVYSSGMFFRGQIIGKYKILSTIGSGGFGTVYLAEDTWIDKKVALKVPHKQNLDFGELLREPRLLAALNHPNIVAILTAEKQEHVFFIVMEFVPGETLESIIARGGALDLPRALDYTCQICNAVDPAHRHGVLHRDLRPAPRLKNAKIPKAINDIILKAMAPDIPARYQRAGEVLDEVLAARGSGASPARRTPRPTPADGGSDDMHEIQTRLKAREAP